MTEAALREWEKKEDEKEKEKDFFKRSWHDDQRYLKFVSTSAEKGYFDNCLDSNSSIEKRLLAIKQFYWSRVLKRPIPEINLPLDKRLERINAREALVLRKLLIETKANTKSNTAKSSKVDDEKILSIADLPANARAAVTALSALGEMLLLQTEREYHHKRMEEIRNRYAETGEHGATVEKLKERWRHVKVMSSIAARAVKKGASAAIIVASDRWEHSQSGLAMEAATNTFLMSKL